jgi:ATP-dependent helicase HrpB
LSSFDPYQSDLPITDVFDETKEKLRASNTLIVNAPPGAGKSTLLPLALMGEEWLGDKKILMLEPRRLAARSIAMRMSELIGESVGQSIGYRVRFDNKVSSDTQIEVLTEGILTRMLQSDNALEDVGMVVFDEFHERSIHADLALALCREAQQVLRPDLKIMIMSATLDMPTLTSLLNCPVVVSEGRQFPVDVNYVGETDIRMLPELAARTIVKAAKDNTGDILAFFPGQGEIKRCEEILKSQLKGFRIHPLYGALPFGKQKAAIMPDQNGQRKVVLATSIAETSLTIEGIKVVVDSGFGRTSKFDPKSGLSRLDTVQIDKDSATQRAGRAGRMSPGVCYRMWTKATHARLTDHRTPEIEQTDLASLVLSLSEWGILNIEQMTWLTPPPKGSVGKAKDTLEQLGALLDGRITEHGKKINSLPCHPRIAHMLLAAQEMGLEDLATDIAAIIEERDPLPREAGIDINLRVEALRRFRGDNNLGRKFSQIDKVASSYRRMLNIEASNDTFDSNDSGILLVQAFPERIASARPGNNAQFQLANGRLAMAGHKDDLAHEPWLAVAHIDARQGMGKIFLASPLNPQDLQPLVKEVETITWDTKKGGLNASLEMRIGNIVLLSKPLPEPDESTLIDAICEALKKEGGHLLNFNEDIEQWQNRILSLRKWNPSENWPDVSTETLLATNKDWLPPYLNKVKKPEDLKKIDLFSVLQNSLEYSLIQKLNKNAPTRIKVPSGSNIKLAYRANGEPPVLAVRIQEVFGLEDTPSVNQGKQAVLMHLLSPGYKPVQTTTDLRNFWKETYFDVKKELKGRYPKHVWPEDPSIEPAIRGTKRKK